MNSDYSSMSISLKLFTGQFILLLVKRDLRLKDSSGMFIAKTFVISLKSTADMVSDPQTSIVRI